MTVNVVAGQDVGTPRTGPEARRLTGEKGGGPAVGREPDLLTARRVRTTRGELLT